MDRPSPLQIPMGDYYTHTVNITDTNGDPIDCTTWEVASQIRALASSPTAMADFHVDDAAKATGTFVFWLDEEETRALTPGRAVTDVQRVLDGRTVTFLRAPVVIERDVTRG